MPLAGAAEDAALAEPAPAEEEAPDVMDDPAELATLEPVPLAAAAVPVLAAVEAQVAEVGRFDTPAGRQML